MSRSTTTPEAQYAATVEALLRDNRVTHAAAAPTGRSRIRVAFAAITAVQSSGHG